ncbi:hypothetical protein NQ317_006738 [Molorchus minor]|uniref:Uncharacterized protein n=1 Tax=Molorchus minor TaxID=1323400 RepID=A0ABQ9IRC1_9CUCU|nr:hypothetical protein NQ317_006738 [Molorchus minor]
MPSNYKGQRTALWEQCSESGGCQEYSAQEAMHLYQRGGHTWLRHSRNTGFSRGISFGNDDFSLESLDPLKN